MPKQGGLARHVGEGVLIVASILLAFGIEAGWEARTERAELQALVELLRVDLTENLESLRGAQRRARAASQEMSQLLGVVHGASPPAGDSLAVLIATSLGGSRFQPTTAAYDAALGTQAWGQIPPAVKVALARFTTESRDNEETLITESYIGLTHAISRHGGLASVMPEAMREYSGLPESRRAPDLEGPAC